jgi:hypothetical protein
MNIRDRVRQLVYVPASELIPNPKNWRTHPEPQRKALTGILEDVGYADALLARKLPDGSLMLIDGHLRAEVSPEEEVPVLILDLNEEESDKLLAILDPLAGMAHSNATAFEALLHQTQTSNESVADMLTQLAEKIGVIDADKTFVLPPNAGGTEYDESVEEDVDYCTCPNCGHEFAA